MTIGLIGDTKWVPETRFVWNPQKNEDLAIHTNKFYFSR